MNDRVRDRILEMAAEGASSRTIAERLNASEVQTSRGGRWHSSTVAGVIRRAKS